MRDPIKPKHRLTKKPNFKKEKLDSSSIFVSPGVYLRETDVSTIQWDRDIFLPLRDEEPNGNGRIYNIGVGDISDSEVDDFMRRMRQTLRVPPRYFGELGHPEPTGTIVDSMTGIELPPQGNPRRVSTYTEYQRLFGHPVGISSRGLVREDGTFDLQSYDIIQNPGFRGEGTDVDVLGGEQMMCDASMFIPLHKPTNKKTLWTKIKGVFSNIYKKWKRVEE